MIIRIITFLAMLCWMLLSLLMVSNFALERFVLPFCMLFSLILTLLWLKLDQSKVREKWQQLTNYWQYPRSLLVVLAYTLVWILVPVAVKGEFPKPSVHDEFSYLLGADTFVHGRLTNPPPLNWEHFESFHITVHPTYQTKYQPGMSLVLAFGIWLCNEPYVGVILSLLAASCSITWMLKQWLPTRWALAMSLLAVTMMLIMWGQNYFVAGPLSTLAGAIQLSLIKRWSQLRSSFPTWSDGTWWGVSLLLLAWTRPFEGLIFSLLMGLGILVVVAWQGKLIVWLLRILPGLLFFLVPATWLQTEYNRALTGSATTFPYFVHDRQYFISPPFLFQSLYPEPEYRHQEIRQFHQEMADFYHVLHSPDHLVEVICFRFGQAWKSFGMLLWLIPFLVLPEVFRHSAMRWLFLLWFIFLGIIQVVTWFLAHYAAPGWLAWFLVIVYSIRWVRMYRWKGKPLGRYLICFCVMNTCWFLCMLHLVLPAYFPAGWNAQKQKITNLLLTQGGKHLVFMEYGPNHNTGEEWVYNGADLQSQPILWARSMNAEANHQLIKNYPGRQVWLIRIDNTKPEKVSLVSYPQKP